MSINKKSATAFINVRGLGIACFNENQKRCETAILRSGNHKLSINVFKPSFIDGSGKDTVGYVPVLSREIAQLNDVSIDISGVGNPKIQGFEFYRSGEFDRLNGDNDENDIRWILNLEGGEMHNQKLEKNTEVSAANRSPVSKLFISNGQFYAVMPDEKEIEKTPFFQMKQPSSESLDDFGYIAETMGVNIEADKVVLKIRIGETEEIHSFNRIEDLPFKIDIWNVDPDVSADASDLPVCYQFLSDKSGGAYELKPKTEDSVSGNPVRFRDFCHLVMVDQDSIDDFV